jgi:carbamoyl-phosphate synthase/aspartate carbamoyltransferase
MNNHLLETASFTKDEVISYINAADDMKKCLSDGNKCSILSNKILVTMFFEPSTRTSCSFQSAMLRLGGSVISLTDKYSSVEKGETLEDTIRSLSCYADAIVLRHPLKGSAKLAASVSTVPIINAGDGNGEHPSQALLDIYTIHSELVSLEGDMENNLIVTFLGDLKNSRTIHSLIRLLCLFPKMKFVYISPSGLEMPAEIVEFVSSKNIEQFAGMSLEAAIRITDVLYVTRIQKERFTDINSYNSVSQYCVDAAVLKAAKKKMIIMHPLPRNQEIAVDVDDDPRAVYFTQMKNGVYMRMAILSRLLSKNGV